MICILFYLNCNVLLRGRKRVGAKPQTMVILQCVTTEKGTDTSPNHQRMDRTLIQCNEPQNQKLAQLEGQRVAQRAGAWPYGAM
jgi:hypothetical protein